MADGIVLVVDDDYRPLSKKAHHETTCEGAIIYLEDTPVAELWIREDAKDAAGITTLVDFLVNETEWSTRSQIGTIVIVTHDVTVTSEIEQRLQGLYPIRRVAFSPDLYEPIAASL